VGLVESLNRSERYDEAVGLLRLTKKFMSGELSTLMSDDEAQSKSILKDIRAFLDREESEVPDAK
jgi:hypothetical protein